MGTLSFIHRYEKGTEGGARPILLLHGTGGDENDLLSLGRMVAPHAPMLSPRGKILENGMPRFFRRLAEGVFDEEDVRSRANDLANFITEARTLYGISAPIALGYSNGANIAAAVMLLRPETLAGAILLRAMIPLSKTQPVNLKHKPVLIVSGLRDPIIPAAKASQLASLLQKDGATVDHRTLPAGHELSQADVTLARTWWQAHGMPFNATESHKPTS
jgi:phospholipase/carboxylesterase